MKSSFAAGCAFLLFASTTAWAQGPREQSVKTVQTPSTMVLPIATVEQVLQYLNTRPYGEVSSLMKNLTVCLQDQVPGDDGQIKARGSCPEISTTLNAIHTAIHSPQTDVPPAETPSTSPSAPSK